MIAIKEDKGECIACMVTFRNVINIQQTTILIRTIVVKQANIIGPAFENVMRLYCIVKRNNSKFVPS